MTSATLNWQTSGDYSAYKAVEFEIRAVTEPNFTGFSATKLPSQQTLTSAKTIVNTGTWNNHESISYWSPATETIDITAIIQEVTTSADFHSGSRIYLVFTPINYPAGSGFISFSSQESSNAAPYLDYSSQQLSSEQAFPETETTNGGSSGATETAPSVPGSSPSTSEQPTQTESIWAGYEAVPQQLNWFTWRASSLPNVAFDPDATVNAYEVLVTDNTDNKTLHFNQDQGRLDGTQVKFPFEIRVRNIGIEDANIEGTPPAFNNNTYIFAGIQIHTLDSEEANSAHVVVGHRGNNPLTVEGKTTNNGSSQVTDIGASAVPLARADLKILGLEDGTIQVFC